MGIPSKKAFDDWRELSNRTPGANAKLTFADDIHHPGCDLREAVNAFVVTVLDDLDATWQEVDEHEVYRWISREPGYLRGSELLFRSRPSVLSKEQKIKRATDSITERMRASDPLSSSVAYRFAAANQIGNFWVGRVIAAVDDYLHIDYEANYARQLEATKLIGKIEDLVDQLKPLLDEKAGERQIGRVEGALELWRAISAPRLERNLRHKAEHQFVRRIARQNQRFNRAKKMKPNVISELMTISAIRHQFDIRTISRICASMAEAERKREKSAMAKQAERQAETAMANTSRL